MIVLIWFKTKAWPWLKKYWKWILFPIGIVSVIIAYLVGKGTTDPPAPQPPDFGKEGEDAVDSVVEATRVRDEKLDELKKKNQERLVELSDDQNKELEELKDKPIEEVVEWFERL